MCLVSFFTHVIMTTAAHMGKNDGKHHRGDSSNPKAETSSTANTGKDGSGDAAIAKAIGHNMASEQASPAGSPTQVHRCPDVNKQDGCAHALDRNRLATHEKPTAEKRQL